MKLDSFTLGRIRKFTKDFRETKGQLPTFSDFEANGFSHEMVKAAEQQKAIESFYVTMTNGSIVRAYKIK